MNGSEFGAEIEYALELHSDPVSLGSVSADGAGMLQATATLPASVSAGVHDVVVMRDGAIIASAQILISAATGGGGGSGGTDDPTGDVGGHLPQTGADYAWLGWVAGGAVLLLALGAMLMIRRRRMFLSD